MKGDDYFSGRHFWVHFWCGLIVGSVFGAWISWNWVQSEFARFGFAGLIGLLFAYCAGKWGDPFWYWILSWWR